MTLLFGDDTVIFTVLSHPQLFRRAWEEMLQNVWKTDLCPILWAAFRQFFASLCWKCSLQPHISAWSWTLMHLTDVSVYFSKFRRVTTADVRHDCTLALDGITRVLNAPTPNYYFWGEGRMGPRKWNATELSKCLNSLAAKIAKLCCDGPRMTEDRDKWRKYVHGVADPRIKDG